MKTFLIAGASKGIGQQIAKQLTQAGDRVISLSRSAAADATVSFSTDIVTGDLPDVDDVIDGIVYCPGSISLKPFRAFKPDDFRADFELNVVGAVRVIQRYLPALQRSEAGSIVLFSTVAVQSGMAFHASIAAAKGAVEGIMRSLAAELAPKIRVNCIAPSLTDTTLAVKLLDTEAKKQAAMLRHPLKNIGNSSNIAAMACMLLSDDTAFMTGQVIKMDGGLSVIR